MIASDAMITSMVLVVIEMLVCSLIWVLLLLLLCVIILWSSFGYTRGSLDTLVHVSTHVGDFIIVDRV